MVTGAAPNPGAATGEPKDGDTALGAAVRLKLPELGTTLADVGKPDRPAVDGGTDLVAASMALARSSLSSPANMIPLSVPVRNVAMGMMSWKNLLSTGLMPFMGWVTNETEYKNIPHRGQQDGH